MLLSKDEFVHLICIVAAGFSLLLLVLFAILSRSIRMRKQKEIEKLQAIIDTEEHERKRIAEDMHDDMGPMLSAIKLQINSYFSFCQDEEFLKEVKQTSEYLDTTIRNMRVTVRNLSPLMLQENGLVASIIGFKVFLIKNEKVAFNFSHNIDNKKFKGNAQVNIYRIIHEMLNNFIKHSNGNQIDLTLKVDHSSFTIDYRDNGHVQNDPHKVSDGSGLRNIQSRVNILNGKMSRNTTYSKGASYNIIFASRHIFIPTNHES